MKKVSGFTKRMIAILLSSMLVVGMIPVTALASEVQENTVREEEAITTYAVTLDANGGYFVNEWDAVLGEYIESTEILNKQIPVGGTVSTFPVFETDVQHTQNMIFSGWSLERDGELISQRDEEYAPVDNCVLYAVWEPVEVSESVKEADLQKPNQIEEIYEDDSLEEQGDTVSKDEESDGLAQDYTEDQEESVSEDDDWADQSVEIIEEGKEESFSNDAAMIIVEKGKCGAKLTWTLDETDTITISGTGEMADYSNLYSYRKSPFSTCMMKTVVIEDGVTTIGTLAFYDCDTLESIIIPDSVTTIKGNAFNGCSSLTSITIPDSVTSIGGYAFSNCDNLTSITIPGSVTTISRGVFSNCSSLTSINIPDSVTIIAEDMFAGCDKLASIMIPDGVTSIENTAFINCSGLNNISIPNSVTSIGNYVFDGCSSLTNIMLPSSVTSIGNSAFNGCSSLSVIHFNGNAPSISSNSFTNVTATAYYPANDPTWTEDVRQNYGGTITWVPWNPEPSTKPIVGSGVITINYNSLSGSHKYYYDDLFFYSDNNVFNNALAILSLGIEMASFSTSEDSYNAYMPVDYYGYTARAKNIRDTYGTIGFNDAKFFNYNYALSDSSDKVAYSFARKTITNGASTDTLVVVPIRGGGYGAEWASNFRVGTSGNSYGFNEASKKVLEDLKSYLQSIEIKGELKLWITGYSRAGATANLLTHYINKEAIAGTLGVHLNTGNVYTYAFATPNCRDSSLGDSSTADNNIYNIISANDFAPKIPLAHWGYSKYGQVKTLPEYSINRVASEFEDITGRKLNVNKLASFWNGITDALSIVVQNRDTYYHDYQEKVSGIFRDEFSQPGGNLSSAFKDMLKTMLGINPVCSLIAVGYAGGSYMQSEAEGLSSIEYMHYPEHYLSWLEYGNSEFATSYSKMSNDQRITCNHILDSTFSNNYKRYRIYCPVDVKVYSADGELLISIVNNDIVVDQLPCNVNGEEKSFYLLGDIRNYHIELTGNDTGSMSYFVDEYNNRSEVVRSVYYYDIPLEENIVYQADVSTEIEDVHEDYSVTNGDVTTEKSLDTLTDSSETFSVDVENGGSDKAFAMAGEAVMLYADINEDQELVRWESDDENVIFDDDTSPSTFVRMPSNNIKVRAIIRQKDPDETLTGLCGKNVYWSLNSAGTLTISGSGSMTDFPDMSSAPWHGMEVKKVVIDEGITSIGTCAFCDLEITSVMLPKSLEKIGDYAFEDCHSLSDVTIPDGLLDLGKASFAGINIKKIEIPDTVSSFGEHTFTNCYNLEQAIIKAPVKKISYGTFAGCSSLKTVYLPNTINRIEKFVFLNCTSLTDIYYNGPENKWNSIIIENGLNSNTCIENAIVHFVEENETITLDESNVSIVVNDQVWTGKPLTPAAVVKCLDNLLTKDVDYTLSYSENINTGTATVTITGMGNYEGTVNKNFIINPVPLSDASVTALASKVYTGKAITQNPTVKVGDRTLTNGKDYTLLYSNNTNPGTATITITGIGNYTGTKTATFTIKPVGWYKDGGEWYYYNSDGTKLTNGWAKDSIGWYWLGADGKITKSKWVKSGGYWYYLGANGVMTTGWQQVGGKWYYMKPSGVMTTGWQQVSGKWYYMNPSGIMTTGWQQVGGKWYYMNPSGVMTTGWQKVGGKWYYMNSSGVMTTGWQKVGGKWYYMNPSGVMTTGWQNVGGKWYYMNSSGVMTTGWQKIGGKWYYMNASGIMVIGWQTIGGKRYYFNSSGVWVK